MVNDINMQMIEEANWGVFLDIGSNHGMYIEPMLRKARIVYAFEPDPTNLDILYSQKFLPGRVVIEPFALGNENKVTKLYLNAHNPGGHSIMIPVAEARQWGHDPERYIETDVRTLDSLEIKEITGCKIDVEGAEQFVLEGGYETFRNNKMIIALETHQTINREKVYNLLTEYGYKVFNRDLDQVSSVDFDQQYLCRN